jgi:hypothetical protein
MAIFGSSRDMSVFRHVNRELLGDIINQQVSFYKFKLGETIVNLYGEASGEKYYDGPTLFNCLITRLDQQYVDVPYGSGYSYILIPTGFTQPSNFVNSTNGCDGLTVPMNNISQLIINDVYGTPKTYNVYRSYYNVTGQLNIWMCS